MLPCPSANLDGITSFLTYGTAEAVNYLLVGKAVNPGKLMILSDTKGGRPYYWSTCGNDSFVQTRRTDFTNSDVANSWNSLRHMQYSNHVCLDGHVDKLDRIFGKWSDSVVCATSSRTLGSSRNLSVS